MVSFEQMMSASNSLPEHPPRANARPVHIAHADEFWTPAAGEAMSNTARERRCPQPDARTFCTITLRDLIGSLSNGLQSMFSALRASEER